jgi:hypothetical protein
MSEKAKPEIVPSITVHRLLDAYPDLEDVLIEMAPPFRKLRNPLLRRSVAKVATLRQAAAVGSLPLNHLVNILREAVGQAPSQEDYEDTNYFTDRPEWFDRQKIALRVDEQRDSKDNEMTLGPILRGAKDLNKGEIIELRTTFIPAPGIEVMKSKGYESWSVKGDDGLIFTYFLKGR